MGEYWNLHTAYSKVEDTVPLPIDFWDLSLWTATIAIILLATSELLSLHYGKTSIIIDRKRLRIAALAVAIIFVGTLAYRIYEIIVKP